MYFLIVFITIIAFVSAIYCSIQTYFDNQKAPKYVRRVEKDEEGEEEAAQSS